MITAKAAIDVKLLYQLYVSGNKAGEGF